MSEKKETTYNLKIAGKDYTIRSADAPEHVKRMAVFADRRLSELMRTSMVTREDAAVITALSLSDELLCAQDELTRLRRELWLAKQPSGGEEVTGAQ